MILSYGMPFFTPTALLKIYLLQKANHYEIISYLNYIYVLIEFTIKILLIVFDSLILVGIILFNIFFIYDSNYYLLSDFLRILIVITVLIKFISYYLFKDIIRTNKLIIRRFVAIILAYIVPLYILWNTPKLYINEEVSIIIYIFMATFFIVGIEVEKKFIFNKDRLN